MDNLWSVKGVVPFVKVDKGLADEVDAAQVMKPMPDLDDLLCRPHPRGSVRHQGEARLRLLRRTTVFAVPGKGTRAQAANPEV